MDVELADRFDTNKYRLGADKQRGDSRLLERVLSNSRFKDIEMTHTVFEFHKQFNGKTNVFVFLTETMNINREVLS